MAEISFNGNKLLKTIDSDFSESFPYLFLHFFDANDKEVSLNIKHQEVRTQKENNELSINGKTLIGNFEKKYKEAFGVKVEIMYQKDGQNFATDAQQDAISLTQFNKWCEENNVTKAAQKVEGDRLCKEWIVPHRSGSRWYFYNVNKYALISFDDDDRHSYNDDGFESIDYPTNIGIFAVKKFQRYGFLAITVNTDFPRTYHHELITPFSYKEIGTFYEGFAKVTSEDRKYGFVNALGKEVIPCVYEDARRFSDGLALVKKDGKSLFIDTMGKEVLECQYNNVYDFSDGLARVEKDGKKGFIDKTGKEVLPCVYQKAGNFSEGLVSIEDGDFRGFIDKTGQKVLTCPYNEIGDFHDGLAKVEDEQGKIGFIDKTGKCVIPCKYSNSLDFSGGMALVSNDEGHFGLIDTNDEEVIPFEYEDIQDWTNGFAFTETVDGQMGWIDMRNNRYWEESDEDSDDDDY